jgi:hypothetical protein
MEQRIAVFVHAVHVRSCGQDGPEYRFAFGSRGVFPGGAHLICGCLSSGTGHSAKQDRRRQAAEDGIPVQPGNDIAHDRLPGSEFLQYMEIACFISLLT